MIKKNDEDNNIEINPIIVEAISNDFYGLNAEGFFLEKIIKPINQSRISKWIDNKKADRNLLRSYFNHVSSLLIPTPDFLNKINFITAPQNHDLQKDFLNNLDKIFTTKILIWCINNAKDDELSSSLSKGMTKRLNDNQYDINEIIDNIHILKDENKKRIFLSEIFLTKNSSYYSQLNKAIDLNENDKLSIVENIFKFNNESIFLNRNEIKKILIEKIKNKSWNQIDKFLHYLTVSKLDFTLDILTELKQEDYEAKNIQDINKMIYLLIDKAIYTRENALIERVIELKEEQPKLTGSDIYLLMATRFYSYLKKDKAQQLLDRIIKISEKNDDFHEVRELLFTNTNKDKPIVVNQIVLPIPTEYFKKEMVNYFNQYLEKKLECKNIKIKKNKI